MVKDDQSTFINQRYLWAVGLAVENFPPGSLLGDRYRVVESQIISDTQIFRFPDIPEELSPYVSAYLKLSSLPLHFPRPYGLVKVGEDARELLLLDRAPISVEGKLYSNIKDSWVEASAIRQVNLMWQMLQLWQPLLDVGMVSTLLESESLRVFGPWVRVLELIVDEEEFKLADLGSIWIDWLEHAKPEISDALADFCFGLSRGELNLVDAIAVLDNLAQNQKFPINIRIASGTDKGPRRDHNEDNCYPAPEHQKRAEQSKILCDRLAIICDGLGGHEGGEIASSMAIKTIETELEVLLEELEINHESSSEPFNPQEFMQKLDRVTRTANDQIVALNDQYHKQAQQRMGTTLVMAVIPHPHEVYIVSVGDSRLYWVHAEGCDQVTVDDDVATRDVILGYSFHSQSTQRVDGGSLIQALGTRASEALFPRIQRLPLDEDCLLLLCSDGLSDYDRVEEIMDFHIRPILINNLPLDRSVTNLIAQANERNGHDNVTVALMRCQLSSASNDDNSTDGDTLPDETEKFQSFFGEDLPLEVSETQDLEDVKPTTNFNLKYLVIIIAILIVGAAIAIAQITSVKKPIQPNPQPTPDLQSP